MESSRRCKSRRHGVEAHADGQTQSVVIPLTRKGEQQQCESEGPCGPDSGCRDSRSALVSVMPAMRPHPLRCRRVGLQRTGEGTFSIDVEGADVRTVCRAIAEFSGRNIVVATGRASATVSITLKNVRGARRFAPSCAPPDWTTPRRAASCASTTPASWRRRCAGAGDGAQKQMELAAARDACHQAQLRERRASSRRRSQASLIRRGTVSSRRARTR